MGDNLIRTKFGAKAGEWRKTKKNKYFGRYKQNTN